MELVTRSNLFVFQLRVSDPKVKDKSLLFELLTGSGIFYLPTSS